MKLSLLVLCILGCASELNAFRARSSFNERGIGGMIKIDEAAKKECNVCKISTDWFSQELDHFEPSDTRTWQQKYYVNDEFYNATAGGPAFLYISGEGPGDEGWMKSGQWVKNGEKFGAFLFQLEHRYYGDSKPTKDISTENLKYLSSEQALADLASFIVGMNEKYNFGPDVKWIVFGGSYAGNLAAWFRSKYPHLAHGAVASSAPILAEVDFRGYHEVVYEALKAHSEECVVAIKDGVDAIDELLTTPQGIEQLNTIYNFCEPLTVDTATSRNISVFFITIANTVAATVQYNNDNINPGTSNVDALCRDMLDESYGATPIERLAHLIAGNCVSHSFNDLIQFMSNTSYGEGPVGSRQWFYQTCTEFGYYQTSNNSTMFSDQFQVDYWLGICTDAFNVAFDSNFVYNAVDDTNTEYGQLDIEVSRTVFVHGTRDPWHALGLLETRDPNAPVILIEGTSHGQDMQSETGTDLPQLTEARQHISDLLASWLQD